MEYVRFCVRESFSMELGSARVVVFASCHGRAVVPSTYTLAHGLLSTLWRGAKYRTPMFIPRRRARATTPLSFSADRITPQPRLLRRTAPHRTAPQFQNRGHHAITPPLTVAQAGNGCVSMSLESSSNSRILIWRIDVWTLVVAVHK